MKTEGMIPNLSRAVCLVLVIVGSWLAPLTASAVEAPTGEVLTWIDEDQDILWIEASVEARSADMVRINVKAPAQDGTRELWQRCRFEYSVAGAYRCGIDVGDGSLARKRLGDWVAGVSVDGDRLDRSFFSIGL